MHNENYVAGAHLRSSESLVEGVEGGTVAPYILERGPKGLLVRGTPKTRLLPTFSLFPLLTIPVADYKWPKTYLCNMK